MVVAPRSISRPMIMAKEGADENDNADAVALAVGVTVGNMASIKRRVSP